MPASQAGCRRFEPGRPLQRTLSIISLAITLLACNPSTTTQSSKIKIGVISPLSGPFAEIAFDCQHGIDAAIADYKTRNQPDQLPLEFIYADSQGDAKIGLTEFRRLTSSLGILGALVIRSPIGMAVNPISAQLGVPIIGLVAHPNFISQNPYAFQDWSSPDEDTTAILEAMKSRGEQRVALLTVEDDWSNALAESFRSRQAQFGGKIVFDESIPPTATDIATLVTKIKLAKPDAVLAVLAVPQLGTFVRNAREQGITQTIYSNFWVGQKAVIQAAGEAAAEGVLFPEMSTDLPQLKKNLTALGQSDRVNAALRACEVGAAWLLEGVRRNPEARTPQEYMMAASATTEIPLADGPLRIEGRQVRFKVAMKKIHQGEVVELRP